MNNLDTAPHVLSDIYVDVTFDELRKKIKTSTQSSALLKNAEKALLKTKGMWQPKAVYKWLKVSDPDRTTPWCAIQTQDSCEKINLGYSKRFFKDAELALESIYTIGDALELESVNASKRGDHLEAYFFDIIGLIALDKTCQAVIKIAEASARKRGWGVSPFLSPGSIHGWGLEEQKKLASLLPIDEIDVRIREDAVLSPFKTISCMIGLGPTFTQHQVGTTCQVCSKNKDCTMRQI